MTAVSHFTLKTLAAITWYAGGLVLLFKGVSLLREALEVRPDGSTWIAVTSVAGIIAGTAKSQLFFTGSCRKNLARIESLQMPKLWQFFRPQFFLFLALMIALGATLSRLAHGRYVFLLLVAALDLSISTALLASSRVFWTVQSGR